MATKELIMLTLFILYVVDVLSDGYGGGHGDYGHGSHHSYSIPHGSGRKFKIRAKGKGMQHMMQMHHHHGGGGGGKKEQEVVYYPVPIYTPVHDHGGYEKEHESKKTEIQVIPIHGGGGGMGGGYGHGGGHGGYGGYGGGGYH